MNKKLFYFGCIGEKGHYWFPQKPLNLPRVNMNVFDVIDATFTPGNTREQGAANEVVIGPIRIIAWCDYTVDSRPASNSNLIGYGYDNAEEMFTDAQRLFPSVMNRQPKPVIQRF